MTAMLSTITEVFTIAIGWIGTVASTITDTPAADGRLCAGLRRYRCRPVQAYVQHLTHRGAAWKPVPPPVLFWPALDYARHPRHPLQLNVYFGVPGSGKVIYAAYLASQAQRESIVIRLCKRFPNLFTNCTINRKNWKRPCPAWSNVSIPGWGQGRNPPPPAPEFLCVTPLRTSLVRCE